MTDNSQPTQEQIALRAYELYLQRGAEPGKDLADWLAAEQELMAEEESVREVPIAPVARPKSAPKVNREVAATA